MQVFNFSKVNSIIDVLSHWVLPNVKHLLEENLKNKQKKERKKEQIPPNINIYTFFIPSMLEELRLVVCLDNS